MKYDFLIVGTGLSGATFAREMTNSGKKCLVIDRRKTMGGNVYTEKIAGIHTHMYGTDEQKNQLQEHLLWENMPGIMAPIEWSMRQGGVAPGYTYHPEDFDLQLKEEGPMTARELMQYLGTDTMRKMYEPIWLENCFRRIEEDKPEIAIIGDCRFMNEIHAVQARGGKVIRLKRSLYECNHQSEIDADNYEGFDDVIENDSMNLQESCDLFIESLIKLGITKKLREINKFTASIKKNLLE